MALLNSNNQYIKLEANGKYEVYPSHEARERYKQSTHSDIIISKYQELIKALEDDEETKYYNDEYFAKQYAALDKEYQLYRYNLMHYICDGEYPIMEKHYPDVASTIPPIIESGYVTLDIADTTEQTYQKAKEKHRWGDTTDA